MLKFDLCYKIATRFYELHINSIRMQGSQYSINQLSEFPTSRTALGTR
jgi:hypothetical protein